MDFLAFVKPTSAAVLYHSLIHRPSFSFLGGDGGEGGGLEEEEEIGKKKGGRPFRVRKYNKTSGASSCEDERACDRVCVCVHQAIVVH